MRNFDGLRVLETAEDLVAFIAEDPLDRILDCRNDDFSMGVSRSVDEGVLFVRSMRALGVTSIDQYVKARRGERHSNCGHRSELAIVGSNHSHDTPSAAIPPDIRALCKAADDQTAGRLLSLAGYEGLCLLASHPEAEVGEADWFVAVSTTDTEKE